MLLLFSDSLAQVSFLVFSAAKMAVSAAKLGTFRRANWKSILI